MFDIANNTEFLTAIGMHAAARAIDSDSGVFFFLYIIMYLRSKVKSLIKEIWRLIPRRRYSTSLQY